MYDAVQIIGSLAILAAFVLSQAGKLRPTSYGYLIANALGSTVLTITAVISREWGFIMLEGVWALVSYLGVARKARGKPAASAH